jgi:Cu/Ag efflux protein CusF
MLRGPPAGLRERAQDGARAGTLKGGNAMRTNALRAWSAGALTAFALGGCSTSGQTAATPAAPLPGGTVSEGLVSATARVKAIDQATRMVTLERADGSVVKFRAGEEVRNLPQVKVGDQVTATYYESMAFQVRKAGDTQMGAIVGEEMARAKPGAKPGAANARVTTVTTRITGIDKQAGTVTLQDPEGANVTVKARYPENLERVAVGDLVEITLTEAVAISVASPAR